MYPKEKQIEKNIKNIFEHEVGEKPINAASFNLYYNPGKSFWQLTQWSTLCKKPNRSSRTLVFGTEIPVCLYWLHVHVNNHGSCMQVPSSFFPHVSIFIETHVHFYSTVLTQIADSFQVPEDEVELPVSICNQLKTNLDEFSTADSTPKLTSTNRGKM